MATIVSLVIPLYPVIEKESDAYFLKTDGKYLGEREIDTPHYQIHTAALATGFIYPLTKLSAIYLFEPSNDIVGVVITHLWLWINESPVRHEIDHREHPVKPGQKFTIDSNYNGRVLTCEVSLDFMSNLAVWGERPVVGFELEILTQYDAIPRKKGKVEFLIAPSDNLSNPPT